MTPSRHFIIGMLFMAFLALVFVASRALAQAQTACSPVEQVLALLAQHGEKVFADAVAITPRGPVAIRIFANPKTGSWTILSFPAPDMACVGGIGERFSPARLPGSDA